MSLSPRSGRSYVKWKRREDDVLREMFCGLHYDPKRIAEELGRSRGAIQSRIKLLQLRPASRTRRVEMFRELGKSA